MLPVPIALAHNMILNFGGSKLHIRAFKLFTLNNLFEYKLEVNMLSQKNINYFNTFQNID